MRKENELDKLKREGQLKSAELVQEIGQNEKKEAVKSSKATAPSSSKKAKELKKKFKSQKSFVLSTCPTSLQISKVFQKNQPSKI